MGVGSLLRHARSASARTVHTIGQSQGPTSVARAREEVNRLAAVGNSLPPRSRPSDTSGRVADESACASETTVTREMLTAPPISLREHDVSVRARATSDPYRLWGS